MIRPIRPSSEFNRSLNARFKRGVGRIEPQYQSIASVETSNTQQTIYGSSSGLGAPRVGR